ncbi:polyketide synthase dehydratase domain-containing protein, partial [Paenibacillus alba]|uniref:polyketide synthase dehydratase domain-containing protein n=1 Tax=Paenibacillus alba TaxID=1197127 RepID=UPI00156617C9
DNGEIQYEIYSPNEGNEEVTVHSEGSILVYTAEDTAEDTPVLDIEALIESCHQKELASKQCYEGFITMGMEYGPAHKGIERIYVGQGQAIAKLRLPDAIADTEEQFKLHPALIDSALQATLGVWAASDPAKPALPFALEDLRVIRGCSCEMWCFVRYSAGSRAGDKVEKLDIDLCDSQGKICVQMRGFSSRVMEGEELGTAILRPYWREQAADGPAEGAAKAEHLVVLCEGDSRLESYIRKEMKVRCLLLEEAYDSNGERFDSSAARVFEEVQQLFKERHKERILVQVVVPSERLQLFEALSGLLKTAQL